MRLRCLLLAAWLPLMLATTTSCTDETRLFRGTEIYGHIGEQPVETTSSGGMREVEGQTPRYVISAPGIEIGLPDIEEGATYTNLEGFIRYVDDDREWNSSICRPETRDLTLRIFSTDYELVYGGLVGLICPVDEGRIMMVDLRFVANIN